MKMAVPTFGVPAVPRHVSGKERLNFDGRSQAMMNRVRRQAECGFVHRPSVARSCHLVLKK